jgi:hypothetical protein
MPPGEAAHRQGTEAGDEISISLASTVASVQVHPAEVSLRVGEEIDFTATALDEDGRILALGGDTAFEWAVTGGRDIASITTRGSLSTTGRGNVLVMATEQASGRSGSASVAISSTIGDELTVCMNLDFFDLVRAPALWDLERFEEEVDDMMRDSALAGVDRILYRITTCGEVMYPSQVLTPFNGTVWGPSEGEVFSHRTQRVVDSLSPLSLCIEAAHRHGLELWAWIDLFDQGYSAANLWDEWLAQHPEYWWRHRDAVLPLSWRERDFWFGMPCYAYPEVRSHVASGIAELCDKYDVDGFFYSVRSHSHPAGHSNWDSGYNPPIVSEYIRRWGEDPIEVVDASGGEASLRFSRLKADNFTQLLRELRALTNPRPVMMMHGHMSDKAAEDFRYVDIDAVIAEDLADEVCLWGTSPSGTLSGDHLPLVRWHRFYEWDGSTKNELARSIQSGVRSAALDGLRGVTLHEQAKFERHHELYDVLMESLETACGSG